MEGIVVIKPKRVLARLYRGTATGDIIEWKGRLFFADENVVKLKLREPNLPVLPAKGLDGRGY